MTKEEEPRKLDAASTLLSKAIPGSMTCCTDAAAVSAACVLYVLSLLPRKLDLEVEIRSYPGGDERSLNLDL